MNRDEIKEKCMNPFKGKRYSTVTDGISARMEHGDDGKYVLYEDAMREIESWSRVCGKLTKEKYEAEIVRDEYWDEIEMLKREIAELLTRAVEQQKK